MTENSALGVSVPRVDGYSKATGKAKYIADIFRPGMLYGKILFSSHAHAKILRIDTKKAENLPGVKAVITSEDTPNKLYGLYIFDRLIFAREKVRHIGEPVAAVAAISEKIAIEAVKLIEVEYEDLPALYDPRAALQPDAPILHPQIKEYAGIHPYIKYGNVCMDATIHRGDIDKGFAIADLIVETTFNTKPMHQASLEPHGCLAEFDQYGKLTIWTATQQMSVCHSEVAKALNIPITQVKIIPATLGGGFGGKLKALFEQICALLAKKSGLPVKLILTREEEFTVTHPRSEYFIKMKTGVKKDGTIIARDVDIINDVGAYSDHALGTMVHAITYAIGPYDIPNVRTRGRSVYTNNPDWGCMRGYGALQTNFASESQLDIIAAQLGIDPADLRLKNLCKEGTSFITTQILEGVHIQQTMEAAIKASGYREKKGNMGPNRGIGIANSMLNTGFLASSAVVRMNEDGTASILTGIVDIGTGTHTVLSQIAAEVFGIPVNQIGIAAPDSDSSPYDTGSISSRTTTDAGNAVRLACEDARAQLIEIAAASFKCKPEEVTYANGWMTCKNKPELKRSYTDVLVESMFVRHGPIIGRGSCIAREPFDHEVFEGFSERPVGMFTFGTQIAEVEVDPATGKTKVLNFTAAHDIGTIVNPIGLEGQVEGGVVQGMGYGLYEELIVDKGKILNPSFVDYRIPTALDTPPIKSVFVTDYEEMGPFGAKGFSEQPMMPPMPAIANAIADATDVRVTTIPITPERLYRAIQQQEKRPDNK